MLYLNETEIDRIGVDWSEIRAVIFETMRVMAAGDFAQPIKPYLRYREPLNRIIAMPAFIGGNSALSGLKWIASFPGNADRGLPRAHSVTVLNEADTGRPLAVINTGRISALRTAGVSAALIGAYLEQARPSGNLKIGIIGMGPIGRAHLEMVTDLYKCRVTEILVHDLKPIPESIVQSAGPALVRVCGNWEEAFDVSDVFITCTVSKTRYILRDPKPGSLHLNVSLRDYQPSMRGKFDRIIVDEWEEVCRENTDIEAMHKEMGLGKDETLSIFQAVLEGGFAGLGALGTAQVNPMGMAAFDIALGGHFYRRAMAASHGLTLPD